MYPKLSSSTFFSKKIFPIIWFGFLGVILLLSTAKGGSNPLAFIGPLLVGGGGFLIMKKIIWNLADDVYDCGDYLLVRKGKIEEKIFLTNILNISAGLGYPGITMQLREPGLLGSEIMFTPHNPVRLSPLIRGPIVDDLIKRVEKAKAASANSPNSSERD